MHKVLSVDYNGQLLFQVNYLELKSYVSIEAKKYNITVTTVTGQPIFKTTLNVEDDKYYTSFLLGDTGMNVSVASIQDSAPTPDLSSGMAVVRFLQLGSLLSTSFNVGPLNLTGVAFSSATEYYSIKAGPYNLTATPGNSNATFGSANLSIGFAYTEVFVSNQIRTFPDRDFRVSYLRASQAVPDVAAVFLSVGPVIFNRLPFRQETPYTSIPYGMLPIVATANTTTVEINGTFAPLVRYTVLTYGFSVAPKNNSNSLRVAVVPDPEISPSMATVRFGNLVPDVGVLKLVFDNDTYLLDFGPSSFVTKNRAPGVYEISLYNTTAISRRFARRTTQGGSVGVGSLVLKQNITLQLGVLSSIFVEGSRGNIFINDDNVPTPAPTPTEGSSGLSGGAIAGIVIGSIAGAILIIWIIVWYYRRNQYTSIP